MFSCPIKPQNIIHNVADFGKNKTGISRCVRIVKFMMYILFHLQKKEYKYSKRIINLSCDNFVFYVFDFNVKITDVCFLFLIPLCLGVFCISLFLLTKNKSQNFDLLRYFKQYKPFF
jgi:hypothetical protein